MHEQYKKGSLITYKGRRERQVFTPTTFRTTALISSPSLLCLRHPQTKAATNYGLVDRQIHRKSNVACQIASPAF